MTCRTNGASPRVRGRRVMRTPLPPRRRSIPARAGPTPRSPSEGSSWTEHPRACGADTLPLPRAPQPRGASPRVRGRHLLTCEVTARMPHFHSCASPFRHGRCGEGPDPEAAGSGRSRPDSPNAPSSVHTHACALVGNCRAPSTQWARRPQSARARTVASEISMQAMPPRYQAGRICSTAAETAPARAGEAAGSTRRGASARSSASESASQVRASQRTGREGAVRCPGPAPPHRASAQAVSGAPARRW